MSGVVGGAGGQRLLAATADDEPAECADHDHGDDYSKDDGFHNAPQYQSSPSREGFSVSSEGFRGFLREHASRKSKKRHKVCLIAMRTTDRSDGTLDTSAHHVLETRGIEPVPDAERHAKTRALLPTWIAANITVLLLTMGAALAVSYGLNFWQALAVGLAAPVVSYGLVGSGRHTRASGAGLRA
jgi:Permease for cytosine/purines, uracil, thiamine, allantoin.